MMGVPGVRRLFRLPARSARDVEREIDDELRSHLAMRVEWLMARGWTRADAEREARRRFGDVERARRQLYAAARATEERVRLREQIESVSRDIAYALRQARRAPGLTITVALTLALGIGANAAMFGIVDRLLLRAPPGVARPDGVSRLYFTRTFSWAGTVTGPYSSYPIYLRLRDEAHALGSVAVYTASATSIGRGIRARKVRRTLATPGYFGLLGVRASLGRLYGESEEHIPLGDAVAVLSYGFWRRQFGGDAGVLGRMIVLGARQYRIIGVAAPDFRGVDLQPTDVWVPFSAAAREVGGDDWYRPGRWSGPTILARLRPGVSSARAETEATVVFRRAVAEEESSQGHGAQVSSGGIAGAALADTTARVELGSLLPGRAPAAARDPSANLPRWLAAMAIVVLIIASGNAVNLLLSRGARRRREIALRVALGAGRQRLVRQLVMETAVLVAIGGIAALVIGAVGGGLLQGLLVSGEVGDAPLMDGRLLAFTLAVTAAAALLTGLLPALLASRVELTQSLKAGAREGTFRRSRVREALLLLQAALSVVLLVGAGLFVRSLRNVLAIDMGYDARRVAVASVDFAATSFRGADVDAYYHTAIERLRHVPGVAAAALATSIPFWSSSSANLAIPGRDSVPVSKDGGPYIVQVTPEYFATVGTRIVRGRGFTDTDRGGTARVAVVSETFARLVWPGEDPIGKCIEVGGASSPCSTVVGVAHDARRQSLDATPVIQYYTPLDQHQSAFGQPAVLVRAIGDPEALAPDIRRSMAAILPDLPFVDVRPLQTLIDPRIQPWRLGAAVFVAFGLLALIIASVGLYGVIAYEVTQRTQEFGIRAALGASADQITVLVLRRGFGLAVAGVVIGAVIARLGARWVAPLLFDTSPTDAPVYTAVMVTLFAAAAAACMIPARRAARADPADALRAD